MVIINSFPDIEAARATVGAEARAADFNTLLDAMWFVANPPYCTVRLGSGVTRTISSATTTAVVWSESVEDSHGDMWASGAPSKVTITRDGVYAVQLNTLWEDAADGLKVQQQLEVTRSAVSSVRRGFQVPSTSPSELSSLWISDYLSGDSLEAQVRHLMGTDVDLQPLRTNMVVMWVRLPPSFTE